MTTAELQKAKNEAAKRSCRRMEAQERKHLRAIRKADAREAEILSRLLLGGSDVEGH